MRILISLAVVVTFASTACAQPGGFGPPGGAGGMMSRLPVFAALDTDQDGAISAAEIEASPQSLSKLDKNADGALAQQEIEPQFGGRSGQGGRGRGRGANRGGFNPRRGGGTSANAEGENPAGDAEEAVAMLLKLDANQDGKIERSEIGSQFQSLVTRGDSNNDDILTKAELTTLVNQETAETTAGRGAGGFGSGFGGPPGGSGGPPAGMFATMMRSMPLMKALDADGDTKISAAELSDAPKNLMPLDADSDGKLTEEELRPDFSAMFGGGGGGFGPPATGRQRPGRPRRPE